MSQTPSQLKEEVLAACQRILTERMENIRLAMQKLDELAGEETKSSAGDKYETARAMLHLEKEKQSAQLQEVGKLQRVLDQLPRGEQTHVALGALVGTANGWFLLGPALGKVVAGQEVFCLSPVAPLGRALMGKQAGDQVVFNGTTHHITVVA